MSKTESDRDILDEIMSLSFLPTHPNVLKIVGVCHNFEYENRPGIVTEYHENESLERYVEKFHHRKRKKKN